MRVLRQLVGDALERVRLLQHGEREIEGLEVGREADARGQAIEKLPEPRLPANFQAHALAPGEIEEGRRTDGAVEVNMEIGLREGVEDGAAAPGVTPR
jgi:hypothetical protein